MDDKPGNHEVHGVFNTGTFPALAGTGRLTRDLALSPKSVEKAHVFIIDDEEIVVEVLKAHLEEVGYNLFTTCTDPTQALDMIEQERPDIVITDLVMPQIDGFELLRRIRASSKLSRVPVLMLTSMTEKETKLKALDLGATDFLSKPVDPTELALRMRNNLLAKIYQDEMDKARNDSDDLLRSILPVAVIDKLKQGQTVIADRFQFVTVLFADLVGFTRFAGQTDPYVVVMLLNQIFSEFDRVVEKHNLEKIKTVGDAYVLAGGLNSDEEGAQAPAVVAAALEMRSALAQTVRSAGYDLQMRIGIHSGPVTAGVIGTRKAFYDIWGDTVNIASRVESSSQAGCIHVTGDTRRLIAERFSIGPAEHADLKGKGATEIYQVLDKR